MRVESSLATRRTRSVAAAPGFGAWAKFSSWLVATPWVVWTLVAINLGSSVAGYIYWYGSEILAAPVYLWPFVPDSPLSATLWAFALLAYHYGRRWDFLGIIAVTGAIKYGLWTDWVWFTSWLSGGGYSLEAWVLSLNHFGMAVEGLALIPLLRLRWWHVVGAAAWYGANDFVDYGLGYRPPLPNPRDIAVIRAFSVASTAFLIVAWILHVAYRRRDDDSDVPNPPSTKTD